MSSLAPSTGRIGRVVVVGAGGAGLAAVESLRKAAPHAEITLISREAELPYYRLNLTRYLAGEVNRPDLFVHSADWYEQNRIQLLLGAEVSALHLPDRAVQLHDGRRMPFDKLLLAAGAGPFIPPIPGTDRSGVTGLRTIQDADAVLKACEAGARCVCIGGGLLGLEVAGALARRGARVTLVEGHGWLLPRQLNQRAGEILGAHAASLGITLRNKAVTREILGDGQVRSVLLEDGTALDAELVVIATGIRSNCFLAKQAGLEVNHGILVNNRLITSCPDILAAGDVAEHSGIVYGLWTASQAQGAVAGQNLAGAAIEFTGLPRSNTLKVLGLDMFSIGQISPAETGGAILEQELDGSYCRFVFHDSRLVGVILLGDIRLMAVARRAVEERRDCGTLLASGATAQAVIEHLGAANSGRSASQTVARRVPQAVATPVGPVSPGRYRCPVCGYVYDEAEADQAWEFLPHDWTCPICSAAKSVFEPLTQDPATPVRTAPGRVTVAHRLIGYAFLAIYLLLMWQMVPRLWTYQIELPARTVVHMSLAMAVGVILLLKILIVRFFKRLDAALVPTLGTSLLIASAVLIGIAVPPAFREAMATSRLFTDENCQRVATLLVQTGMDKLTGARLASHASLRAGQRILRQQCVACHDLRTVIARPRTPDAWRQTVRRMAERATLPDAIDDHQQWQVTAYLVALSPQLQQSAQQLRDQTERRNETRQAAAGLSEKPADDARYDAVRVKQLFEIKCSECHATTEVEKNPPDTESAARDLIKRMVDEGLAASEEELSQLTRYLIENYIKKANQ